MGYERISPQAVSRRRVEAKSYPSQASAQPQGFSELPMGFVLWMLVRHGRVVFISAGKEIWGVAARLQKKYKADRILYMPTSYLNAEETVAALVAHYQPPYNFKSQSIQLAELDAILSSTEN